MYLSAVIVLALLIGGLSLYISLRVLRRFSWFLQWLRGTVGFFLLALSACVLFAAYDLTNYSELLKDRPIASISFEKIDEQHYKASISYYVNKDSAEFEIHGDQWQVDSKIIRWTGLISALGAKPGFRLDRISGRYYSLEDERSRPRSVFSLWDQKHILDAWTFLDKYGDFFPGIDAAYGSAAYLPMADAASYQLSLSHNGLTASPVNEIAKNAVKMWR